MIISGGSRSNWRWFSQHLLKDENDRVREVEFRYLGGQDVREAFREMDFVAGGSRTKNFFYHANLNPKAHETLTDAQWEEAVGILERHLKLEGHARFVVEHEKEGRTHRHVVWCRIDPETMTAVSDSFTARDHEKAAREIEATFELEPVASVLTKGRDDERPERRPRNWETYRGHESGIDPQEVKAQVTAIWNSADNGQAFKAALEESGFILAKGDRRDFVLVDAAGDDHSLARRISGAKAAEIRARLSDIDRDALPSVAEARALAEARADASANGSANADNRPSETDATTTPHDEQQVAASLIEPEAEIDGAIVHDLAQRFGDAPADLLPASPAQQSEEEPGSQASELGAEILPGERSAATAPGEAGSGDIDRTHAPDEMPRRVSPWSFSGMAERLTRYAGLFREFIHDERSGTPNPEAASPETADADSEHGWVWRVAKAGFHAIKGWRTHDAHEMTEGVSEAAGLAWETLIAQRKTELPPPDEDPHMARANGKAVEPFSPDGRPQDAEHGGADRAQAWPAAPMTEQPGWQRYASLRGTVPDSDTPLASGWERFVAQRDQSAKAAPLPAPPPPEPDVAEPDLD